MEPDVDTSSNECVDGFFRAVESGKLEDVKEFVNYKNVPVYTANQVGGHFSRAKTATYAMM